MGDKTPLQSTAKDTNVSLSRGLQPARTHTRPGPSGAVPNSKNAYLDGSRWSKPPRDARRAATVLLTLLGLGLIGLSGRIFFINTELSDVLHATAARQQHGQTLLPARRGMILDSRGRVMAISRQVPDVFVDPGRCDDPGALAEVLSARLNQPADDILKTMLARPGSRYVVVAREVDEITAEAIRALHHPAVGLTLRDGREYPLGVSAAQLLGFVGRDGDGLEGIELGFNAHLRGHDGRRETLRDARRRALRGKSSLPMPPVDGGHVVLTLDAEIQRMAEEKLAKAMQRVEAESAVAIVMCPRSGDVLAMAGLPGYDANLASNTPPELRRNRAITDPVEPGSTFKPVILCGALSGGFVTPTEQINCHMGMHRFGRRLVKDTKPSGMLDLRGIITRSSNIGMGTIAERMGNSVLHDTIRAFGFGARSGIDLPGEASGIVYPLRRWTSYSTTSVCIGYEVSVTPLQLINAFSAIVNGGVLLRPRMVRSMLHADGSLREAFEVPEPIRRATPAPVAEFVTNDLLAAVIEDGTAHVAQVGPYKVVGKTGTTRLTFPDRRGYEHGAYLSTFVGAAPADNPEVVVLVMVRRPNPRIAYYGAAVSAKPAGELLSATLAYLRVPPDRQQVSWMAGRP